VYLYAESQRALAYISLLRSRREGE